MSLRRAAAGRYLIFQKDSENFDGLERAIGGIRQFQKEVVFGLNESKGKRLLFIAHYFDLVLVLRFRPFFF